MLPERCFAELVMLSCIFDFYLFMMFLVAFTLVSLQLVAVLRKLKMTVRLKDARETFAAKFPMHEHLWLDWISDALAEASGGRIQYPEVLLLAQRALLDYNTASLWQQFLECGPLVTGN